MDACSCNLTLNGFPLAEKLSKQEIREEGSDPGSSAAADLGSVGGSGGKRRWDTTAAGRCAEEASGNKSTLGWRRRTPPYSADRSSERWVGRRSSLPEAAAELDPLVVQDKTDSEGR